jgi:hypothetical protein
VSGILEGAGQGALGGIVGHGFLEPLDELIGGERRRVRVVQGRQQVIVEVSMLPERFRFRFRDSVREVGRRLKQIINVMHLGVSPSFARGSPCSNASDVCSNRFV